MITFGQFNELAYDGNIGIHELMLFYSKASEDEKDLLQQYLEMEQLDLIVDLLYKVTGVRLKPSCDVHQPGPGSAGY